MNIALLEAHILLRYMDQMYDQQYNHSGYRNLNSYYSGYNSSNIQRYMTYIYSKCISRWQTPADSYYIRRILLS